MTAIVLAGHGSRTTGMTANPVITHADRIRAREEFDEVRVAFWKEDPSLRTVLRRIESDSVTVIPMMMSEGYFVQEVFPRELRLTDEETLDTGKSVQYTEPVGTHPLVISAISDRIDSICDPPIIPEEFGLALVGHGTDKHEDSAVTTYSHVDRLRKITGFSEVRGLFLDESPRIDSFDEHFMVDNILVVPLFIANGTHTTEDIPTALGIGSAPTPQRGRGDKKIWYSGAVGTEPVIADIAIQLATDLDATLRTTAPHARTRRNHRPWASPDSEDVETNETRRAHELFRNLVRNTGGRRASDRSEQEQEYGYCEWGEILIYGPTPTDPTFAIRHRDDRAVGRDELDHLDDWVSVRDRIRYTDDGDYRPLRAATTLPTGWTLEGLSRVDLTHVIDVIYPGSIIDWYRNRAGKFPTKDYQAATERHSGIYASVSELRPEQLDRVTTQCCTNCVKEPIWYRTTNPPSETQGSALIPCQEPCGIFLDVARQTQNTKSPSRGLEGDEPGDHGRDPRPTSDQDIIRNNPMNTSIVNGGPNS